MTNGTGKHPHPETKKASKPESPASRKLAAAGGTRGSKKPKR
jgi:hypothetical protein